jgi:hypothetical protein
MAIALASFAFPEYTELFDACNNCKAFSFVKLLP